MKNKNLLVVDDDPDILESLKVVLGNQGYHVETASNKSDGLKLCYSHKPDLVILDIMMEDDLEGYGMLNDFRKDDSLAGVPIIMYSGMAQQIGVNFRSAVEDEKMFPKVSFVDKREDMEILIEEVKKALND